jgi:hypothetical protein
VLRSANFLMLLIIGFPMTCDSVWAGGNDPIQATNLGKVNSKFDETDPFLAADNLSLLYVSNSSGNFDMYLATRSTAALPFGAGQPMTAFNTRDADERSPFYTADRTLYFASNRIPDPSFKDLQNFDIFERFGPREPSQLFQVSTKRHEIAPWLTPKGTEFYFSRKTDQGWRVFVAKGPAFGGVGEGVQIDEIPAGFSHPTLTPNGLSMYLQGPGDKDRSAIFRSTRAKVGGKWSEPKQLTNLAHPESKQGDMSPRLSASGLTLFFASDRPGGQGGLDLWSVKASALRVAE